MPFDPASPRAAPLPAWLRPETIDALATMAEQALRRGAPEPWVRNLAKDYARALHPALAAPELEEAVALAMWAVRR